MLTLAVIEVLLSYFAIKAALVLVLTCFLDFVWASYTVSLQRAQHFKAGIMAAGIYGFGAVVTLSYIDDHRLVGIALFGSFFGTYFSSKYLHKEKANG